MDIKYEFYRLGVLKDEYGFNWAHSSFHGQISNDEMDGFILDVQVKIPQKHTDLNEIKKIVFNQIKLVLKNCENFDPGEQH